MYDIHVYKTIIEHTYFKRKLSKANSLLGFKAAIKILDENPKNKVSCQITKLQFYCFNVNLYIYILGGDGPWSTGPTLKDFANLCINI